MENPNNGIECTCTPCKASHHKRHALPIKEFVDKNGTQIGDGDRLKYTNPNHPKKEQPLCTAFIKDGDCWILTDGDKEMHYAKSSGAKFNSKRFEIVS